MAEKWPKIAQKLPKMAQKLAPAKKTQRYISSISNFLHLYHEDYHRQHHVTNLVTIIILKITL